VDFETLEVADNKERRVAELFAIIVELGVSLRFFLYSQGK